MKKATLLIPIALLALGTLLFSSSKQNEYSASIPGWYVDLEEAERISQETGKPILANFTGTDWCGWCKVLKREVFATKKFKEWAAENVVLLEVDFPKSFKLPQEIASQNAGLQRALRVSGYPTIWVFKTTTNPDTGGRSLNAMAKTGYLRGGPDVWIPDLDKKIDFANQQMNK